MKKLRQLRNIRRWKKRPKAKTEAGQTKELRTPPQPRKSGKRPAPPLPPNEVLEASISLMKGVSTCRVVTADERVIEIHLVTKVGSNQKQIIDTLRTILLAKHGVSVDPQKTTIRVIQMDKLQQRLAMGNMSKRLRW